jgi:MYXO-CTERM domain-containing protein
MSAKRLAGAATITLLCAFGDASAFVPYRTTTGQAYHWSRACVGVRVYSDDLSDMTPSQIMDASRGAAAAWSAAANPCSFVSLVVRQASGPGPKVSYDGIDTTTFRRTSWCNPDDPPGACSYPPEATALTTIFVMKSTGVIVDADIEVNAKNFVWGDVALQPGTKQDLQSTLTHEMGHLLGFDHTCVMAGAPGAPPLDDMGNPVPSCDDASAAVRATTLFPSVTPNDVSKRTLEPDDQRAVCTTYPASDAGAPDPDAGLPTYAACTAPLDGGADASDPRDADAPDARADAAAVVDGAAADTAGAASPASRQGCDCSVGDARSRASWLGLGLVFVCAARRRRRHLDGSFV